MSSAPSRVGDPQGFGWKAIVPDPENIFFTVQYPGRAPTKLAGHFWFNAEAVESGTKCPAIVEVLPYRRRDGTLLADSKMYPWFAANEYLCFRVDLQGSGDSEGVLTDEYTDEELSYCVQLIEQIAAHPYCDGNVGMMGKSWSAINSLMVAARADRPQALKAIICCCGSDDRYNDDVHYMGGAMMFDNVSWPSSMWGWLALPPDPAVVGDAWKEMWRTRIQGADFWFKQWATHQTRDEYWSATAVRGRYQDVKIPVHVLAGWQDGYRNPVERIVRGLAAAGTPVTGMLGPWGHKYPFDGYPGPRIDWLRYAVTQWWDKWLKGAEPDASEEWPQLSVWLEESSEPATSPCADTRGRWVAEDAGWKDRAGEWVLNLGADRRMGPLASEATYVAGPELVLDSAMLETSSWGVCGNDDLPGDQSAVDRVSVCFDSDPLVNEVDVFGYPTVRLVVSCDAPIAAIAVRLCEVSPVTQASHLVNYRFFNLAIRGADLSPRTHIVPGSSFRVSLPLTVIGHTFKAGWRVRLAISASLFPTMWQSPERVAVELHTGQIEGGEASALVLPTRPARSEDERMAALLPPVEEAHVRADEYMPTLAQSRPATNVRRVEPISIDDRPGMRVTKVFDNGRYQYGGPLAGLWVDQVAEDVLQIVQGYPSSLTGSSRSSAILERPGTGWRARAETTTSVWTTKSATGAFVFQYAARIRTYVASASGEDELFEERNVEGEIARTWV